jgi:hypothetical protein
VEEEDANSLARAAASGEHRLLACSFRQPAEKLSTKSDSLTLRKGVVGKLPTTAG